MGFLSFVNSPSWPKSQTQKQNECASLTALLALPTVQPGAEEPVLESKRPAWEPLLMPVLTIAWFELQRSDNRLAMLLDGSQAFPASQESLAPGHPALTGHPSFAGVWRGVGGEIKDSKGNPRAYQFSATSDR